VISPTQINLSYGSSTDDVYLAGYQIQSCTGAGCTNFSSAGGATALTYDKTNLTPSTTYQFVVFAIDGSGNQSPPSNVVAATTLPGAPTTLTASNTTSTQVTLSWTPTGNVAGLADYLIEQCRGAGCSTFSQVAQVSGPSGQITGLTPRTTYQFRVRSADPSGNDSGLLQHCDGHDATIAGRRPSQPQAYLTPQITLAWTASTAPGVSAYLIERCAGASCTNFVQIGSIPNSPYMDGGLLPLTTYQYRIRAQDAAGDLSDYVATSATTITLAAPYGAERLRSLDPRRSTSVGSPPPQRASRATCSSAAAVWDAPVSRKLPRFRVRDYSDTGLATNTTIRLSGAGH